MTKKKTNTVARLEFVVIIIFFIAFIVWTSNQCNRRQASYEEEDIRMAMIDSLDSINQIPPAPQPQIRPREPQAGGGDTIGVGNTRLIREKILPLYITIDGMNMRRGPGLNFDIVDRLGLYEEVSFLNEVTDSLHTIKLGDITTTEPWVKVRTSKGKSGWVYGAGVSYYKKKLEGVDN